MLEAYNGGVLFGNIPGATSQEIMILGLDTKTEGKVKKAHISVRGEYLATAFLLISDRLQYGKLILPLENDHAKQQRNYPRTLTYMYGQMGEW